METTIKLEMGVDDAKAILRLLTFATEQPEADYDDALVGECLIDEIRTQFEREGVQS